MTENRVPGVTSITPVMRVRGNGRAFRVQQRVGAGWETLSERYATAAEARAAITRMGGVRR